METEKVGCIQVTKFLKHHCNCSNSGAVCLSLIHSISLSELRQEITSKDKKQSTWLRHTCYVKPPTSKATTGQWVSHSQINYFSVWTASVQDWICSTYVHLHVLSNWGRSVSVSVLARVFLSSGECAELSGSSCMSPAHTAQAQS